MRRAIAGIVLLLAFAFMGTMDYADALVTDAIRKDPPRIYGYTIKQDSPGIERVVLTCPVEPGCKQAKSKKRRKDIQ